MANKESISLESLFGNDAEAHKFIQGRAKRMIDFLQIDDDAFYKKIPHLNAPEPYKYDFETILVFTCFSGLDRRFR